MYKCSFDNITSKLTWGLFIFIFIIFFGGGGVNTKILRSTTVQWNMLKLQYNVSVVKIKNLGLRNIPICDYFIGSFG